jgi:single-stranded DNA-binding protein
VVGRLRHDLWTDADGKGHSKILVVAEHVEFKPQFKGRDGNAAGEEQAVATANRSSYLSASTMAILYLRTKRRVPRCPNIE